MTVVGLWFFHTGSHAGDAGLRFLILSVSPVRKWRAEPIYHLIDHLPRAKSRRRAFFPLVAGSSCAGGTCARRTRSSGLSSGAKSRPPLLMVVTRVNSA